MISVLITTSPRCGRIQWARHRWFICSIWPRVIATALFCTVWLNAGSVWAIVDLDSNGLSDVWEQRFLAQGIDPNSDTDGDGQNSLAESLAGTNPFDSN